MWSKVGIIRCGKSLGEALEKMASWPKLEEGFFMSRQGLELRNMAVSGSLIAQAAFTRKGSVGRSLQVAMRLRGAGTGRGISPSKRRSDGHNRVRFVRRGRPAGRGAGKKARPPCQRRGHGPGEDHKGHQDVPPQQPCLSKILRRTTGKIAYLLSRKRRRSASLSTGSS